MESNLSRFDFTMMPESGYTVSTKLAPNANVRRGYMNYDTTITFKGYSDKNQNRILGQFLLDLQLHSMDMWVGSFRKIAPDTWVVNHGYDCGG